MMKGSNTSEKCVRNGRAPKGSLGAQVVLVAGGALLFEAKYMKLMTLLTLFFGQCVSFSTFVSWMSSSKIMFAWKENVVRPGKKLTAVE